MGVNFNSNNYIQNPEMQQRMSSQENFGAIDREKLKQDTAEFSQKTQTAIQNDVKDSGVVRAAKNVVPKDNSKKKFLVSLALTVITTVGLAVLGNKTTDIMTKAGLKVDDLLLNTKWYTALGESLKKAKSGLGDFLMNHSKTYQDIIETFKNRKAKQKCDMARGYGNGLLGIHALTPLDILDKIFKNKNILFDNKKVQQETAEALKKQFGELFGENIDEISSLAIKGKEKKLAEKIQKIVADDDGALLKEITKAVSEQKTSAQNTAIKNVADVLGNLTGDKESKELAEQILGFAKDGKKTNVELCDMLTNGIANKFDIDVNNKKALNEIFELMKQGATGSYNKVDYNFSEFKDIVMKDKGLNPFRLMSDWWPTNIVNSIGHKIQKITGKEYKDICLGNLGDSLRKYNAVKGNMAKTLPGKLVQNLIGAPAESISNFYNDKSGLGFFLCLQMLGLFNNVQDAPKEQKAATVADDFITTMGGFVLATPLAFRATYGLATLANLQGKNISSRILRTIGRFFNMGLDKYVDGKLVERSKISNFVGGKAGGALRFILIMFTFGNLFRKPFQKLTHKIFGKPYNPAEAEKEAQIEEQKNTVIPELGITQGELMDKINANPQAIQELQNKPQLIQQMQKNPKLILDYLDGKPIDENPIATNISKNGLSQANAMFLNRGTSQNTPPISTNTSTNATDMAKTPAEDKTVEIKNETKDIDNVSYIPKSDFIAKDSNYTDAQTQEINDALAKADKVLARAEKYM